MSLNSGAAPQRRRGPALENALLVAAWDELNERGYDDFTIDGVAARAHTSRAVLYRRWPGKPELVHAALIAAITKDPLTVPDSGSLRGDVINLLQQANSQRGHLAVTVITRLGGFYRDTGTTIAELRNILENERGDTMNKLIARAIARGEIRPDQIDGRLAQLPTDLLRHDVLFTLTPLTDEAIEEIVDTVFLPLVQLRADHSI
ncbi:TetR family transcriptional regulator [Mycobacteroides abscessus subsp. abscessus]|uniref:TetR/AcrR family transcriptional regulator n=2 Tax=Mycobacteroides abscessus TaxID=36809 RepID=A0ABD7HG22_9MYCO|nr:TetR/AcrR family transcriptional regulator [Mycobacteroides abscessus]NOS02586.1 TetR/AcrR family transcriptional regulator [Mycobacteroides abscessus]PVA19163.1 TetR family transcriptional regulator [Mycobacteroides abscessus]PVA34441.1 TetR family transcriptional regulator [Mycobacteroides abscessus]PVA53787.1 TetR family transcriptional regulator [Mycobacteroides abscessus]RIQ94707.1 TetR/AcrR family transcriptional regulator [Mycobacteroides abscessus]